MGAWHGKRDPTRRTFASRQATTAKAAATQSRHSLGAREGTTAWSGADGEGSSNQDEAPGPRRALCDSPLVSFNSARTARRPPRAAGYTTPCDVVLFPVLFRFRGWLADLLRSTGNGASETSTRHARGVMPVCRAASASLPRACMAASQSQAGKTRETRQRNATDERLNQQSFSSKTARSGRQ